MPSSGESAKKPLGRPSKSHHIIPVNFHRFVQLAHLQHKGSGSDDKGSASSTFRLSPQRELQELAHGLPGSLLASESAVPPLGCSADLLWPVGAATAGTAEIQMETSEKALLLEQLRQRAAPWQYGSILYDPIRDESLCWCAQVLVPRSAAVSKITASAEKNVCSNSESSKTRREKAEPAPKTKDSSSNEEGISCDFCGWTEWVGEAVEETSVGDVPTQPMPLSSVKAAVKTSCKRLREENEKDISVSTESFVSSSNANFLHCNRCEVDFCMLCCEDVKKDKRYHVPTLLA